MKFNILLYTGIFSLTASCSIAQNKTDHSDYILKKEIWNTSLADFQKAHATLKFKWQTASKKSLLSPGGGATLFGMNSGETIVKGKNGKVGMFTFSVYNRGDHGEMSATDLDKKFNSLKLKLDETTGKKHRDVSKNGAVKLTAYLWKTDTTAFQLEKSSTGNRAQFLQLRVASLKDANAGNKTASRSGLKRNVKEEENGDVWIQNIPMVDQGQKGYCACASSARIFQYYGRNLSMHQVAEMAGSTAAGGTSMSAMVSAFRKVAGKLNSRILVVYEYPKTIAKDKPSQSQLKSGIRELIGDINKYQSAAKKKEKALTINGKVGGRLSSKIYSFEIMNYIPQMDPEIYKEIMVKKSSYRRFQTNIKKYIDEGVPVGWCLQLGMFKEPKIPQVGGGHMRLIIGYNEKTDEVIYSDSWGAGHEKKSMPMANAFCMSNVLVVMPPTR